MAQSSPGSHIEPEFDYVAVVDDVLLAFDAKAAGLAGLGKGAQPDQVVEVDDLGGDKAALEIGVDDAGGGGRLVAGANGPGPRLILAGGEVGAQAQQVVHGPDQGADAALRDAKVLEVFFGLGFGQVHQLALDLCG